ncbi:hypothetical protein [Chitinophaga nivalis]|uniref:Uncharacterized protein n=1 Tax=Chitinophaga nivalis TaxID=2991709 RepID=A0ABT3IRH2_9BACT|nr:hypothetical protein [Chitinophaga nivalis]MCW3463740.1 hypothetical protein [Chitinophaga nivalis]MCW3486570.1 hypothetical protein [Chitinophaga nivalis]
MISLHELQSGDTVITRYGDVEKKGKILQVDREDKKVLVLTDENEFWYDLDNLYPIYLTGDTLLQLQFHVDAAHSSNADKLYVRGPFSVRLYPEGHKPAISLHYRDETRDLNTPITLNELQNHYHAMTNFHLE